MSRAPDKCPMCGSLIDVYWIYQGEEKGGLSAGKAVTGGLLFGSLGAAVGAMSGKTKHRYLCKNCGYSGLYDYPDILRSNYYLNKEEIKNRIEKGKEIVYAEQKDHEKEIIADQNNSQNNASIHYQNVPVIVNESNISSVLSRIELFLEDHEWQRAEDYSEQVLNYDAHNAKAYVYKLMAELKVDHENHLRDYKEPFDELSNYKKAFRFGDDDLKAKLENDIVFIKQRNKNQQLEKIYQEAQQQKNAAEATRSEPLFKQAAKLFNDIQHYKDSSLQERECIQKAEESKNYGVYLRALKLLENAQSEEELQEAINLFASISERFDVDVKIRECQKRIQALRFEKEHAKKRLTRILAIGIASVIAIAIIAILTFKVFIPSKRYNEAVSLKTSGKFEQAIPSFKSLNGYKDSAAQIEECETAIKDIDYSKALSLKNASKYQEAINAFEKLSNYKDSAAQIKECETAIKDIDYSKALSLKNAGKYQEAINAFEKLSNYKDSAAQIKACETAIKDSDYSKALSLKNAGKYQEAINAFEALNGYKNSKNELLDTFSRYFRASTIGDTVVFGRYEQDNNIINGTERIEWIVLAKEKTKILLISKYGLDTQPYHSERARITWEECSLRGWLNATFLKTAFNTNEQHFLIESKVAADKNPKSKASAGTATQDKVFLLSIKEAGKYFKTNKDRLCSPTAYAIAQGVSIYNDYIYKSGNVCYWWLRTPGSAQNEAARIDKDGSISYYGYDVCWRKNVDFRIAVRPSMWISFEP